MKGGQENLNWDAESYIEVKSQSPSADFSGTEREREKEEKEHGETIEGPSPCGA